ncbi:MAG: sulfotransferase [Anaerolineales bacterium]|nr:sulfotransferase [Anaerolineales bacterium]
MFIEKSIKQRIFIVGCPRSGTTLLQGMLNAHPQIQSFPETHFFSRAYPRHRIKRLVTWPALNVQTVLEGFLSEIKRPDLIPEAKTSLFTRHYAEKFCLLLDKLTVEANKNIWVEKTPRHLHFIKQISNQIPNSKFIHIVRNGPDVVASLYQATNENPRAWTKGRTPGFKGFSVDECINRWNHDVQITARYQHMPNHLIVKYNLLVNQPELSIQPIADFLHINYVPAMLSAEKAFHEIVGANEPWKSNNKRSVHTPESKFKKIFPLTTQQYILDQLIAIDF